MKKSSAQKIKKSKGWGDAVGHIADFLHDVTRPFRTISSGVVDLGFRTPAEKLFRYVGNMPKGARMARALERMDLRGKQVVGDAFGGISGNKKILPLSENKNWYDIFGYKNIDSRLGRLTPQEMATAYRYSSPKQRTAIGGPLGMWAVPNDKVSRVYDFLDTNVGENFHRAADALGGLTDKQLARIGYGLLGTGIAQFASNAAKMRRNNATRSGGISNKRMNKGMPMGNPYGSQTNSSGGMSTPSKSSYSGSNRISSSGSGGMMHSQYDYGNYGQKGAHGGINPGGMYTGSTKKRMSK